MFKFMQQRMLLVHDFTLAAFRREMINRSGIEETKKFFMRLGYEQGVADARQLSDQMSDDLTQLFEYGPVLRELQGFAHHRAIDHLRFNENTGEFWAEYAWENSWEAQAHLEHFGIAGSPACWMMTAYACGYSTYLMGRPILWKETECVAMGHDQCRVIGLPLEEEPNPDQYLEFMSVEAFIAQPKSRHFRFDELQPKTGSGEHTLPDMVGISSAFSQAAYLCKKVSATPTSVLLLGESGVGKERFANAIHSISERRDGPFISVNCAAIPKDLVESELFGVEKGAYTGADSSRAGKFERACGGTLFLDEIGCLPYEAQGKLLRAIQQRVIERVGGTNEIPVNIRIIAATNSQLAQDVKEGLFREDLYYRINVFPIEIPPLRKRSDDIPLLVNLFVQRFAERIGKTILGVSKKAFAQLMAYSWPGNVRELENVCERAVILADENGYIDLEQLRLSSGPVVAVPAMLESVTPDLDQAWQVLMDQHASFSDFEHAYLAKALEASNGNMSAAARRVAMKRGQFEYRLKKANHEPSFEG